MNKETFKNKVEKQKEKIAKLQNRLKLEKEKDKLRALLESCTHEYGSYSKNYYYYEPPGYEIGYTDICHYCNLCGICIKEESNYNSLNFVVAYDYFSERNK